MKIDCSEIRMARNRIKRQHEIYLYEAEINMLKSLECGSVSEIVHAIVASFLRKIGKDMKFLKSYDLLKIKEIYNAITYNK
jgi:hypothetical protein